MKLKDQNRKKVDVLAPKSQKKSWCYSTQAIEDPIFAMCTIKLNTKTLCIKLRKPILWKSRATCLMQDHTKKRTTHHRRRILLHKSKQKKKKEENIII